MDLATLGVAIDPTRAVAGGATVISTLERIARAGEATHTAVANIGTRAGTTAAATGSAFDRMRVAAGGMFDRFRTGAESMGQHFVLMTQRALGMAGAFGGLTPAITGASAAMVGMTSAGGALMLVLAPLAALLGALVTVLGLVVVAGDRYNVSIGRINSAVHDLDVSRTVYDRLYESALKVGVGLDQSTRAFTRFRVAGNVIGAADEDVLKLVNTIQMAGIVAGSTTEELAAATLQLGQALASGKFGGDEFRSIMENLPALAQKLAKELNTTTGGLYRMRTEGTLTATNVFPALLRTSEAIRKEFEAMPPTIGRGLGSLRVALERVFADLDRGPGLSRALAVWLKDASVWVDHMRGSIVEFSNMLGQIALQGNFGEYIYLKVKVSLSDAFRAAIDNFDKWFGEKIVELGKLAAEVFSNAWKGVVGLPQAWTDARARAAASTAAKPFTPFAEAPGVPNLTGLPTPGGGTPGGGGVVSLDLNDPAMKEFFESSKKSGEANQHVIDWLDSQRRQQQDAFVNPDRARVQQLEEQARARIGAPDKPAALRPGGKPEPTVLDPAKEEAAARKIADEYRHMFERIAASRQTLQEKVETGNTDMLSALRFGMVNTVNQWGTATKQMADLAGGVMNTLSAGISGALGAIVTGTKDAATAFREMAVSILNDIANMIIKMLVQLAIQEAINLITGGKTGGVTAASSAMGTLQIAANAVPMGLPTGYQWVGGTRQPIAGGTWKANAGAGMASGGMVYGGSGNADDVPAMLTGGEFVLSRDAVRRLGIHYVEALNRGAMRTFATGGPVNRMPYAAGGGRFSGGADGITINIPIDASGGGDAAERGDKRKRAEQFGRSLREAVIGVIEVEKRQGGVLRKR